MAPAHPHTTGVAVYPALFFFDQEVNSSTAEEMDVRYTSKSVKSHDAIYTFMYIIEVFFGKAI